jgi:hypothetical protein
MHRKTGKQKRILLFLVIPILFTYLFVVVFLLWKFAPDYVNTSVTDTEMYFLLFSVLILVILSTLLGGVESLPVFVNRVVVKRIEQWKRTLSNRALYWNLFYLQDADKEKFIARIINEVAFWKLDMGSCISDNSISLHEKLKCLPIEVPPLLIEQAQRIIEEVPLSSNEEKDDKSSKILKEFACPDYVERLLNNQMTAEKIGYEVMNGKLPLVVKGYFIVIFTLCSFSPLYISQDSFENFDLLLFYMLLAEILCLGTLSSWYIGAVRSFYCYADALEKLAILLDERAALTHCLPYLKLETAAELTTWLKLRDFVVAVRRPVDPAEQLIIGSSLLIFVCVAVGIIIRVYLKYTVLTPSPTYITILVFFIAIFSCLISILFSGRKANRYLQKVHPLLLRSSLLPNSMGPVSGVPLPKGSVVPVPIVSDSSPIANLIASTADVLENSQWQCAMLLGVVMSDALYNSFVSLIATGVSSALALS